ncbi:MAG: hypothetical protein AB7S68_07915 [Polyangiaceae bacterium]
MSARDKSNRSGDTVPPAVLGRNPAVEDAIRELTVGLEPGEDALFVKPDWAERDAVRAARERTTQRMSEAELQAIRGETANDGSATDAGSSDTPPELQALYQKQLITIRTRTIGQKPADFAEDEFDDISSRKHRSDPPTAFEGTEVSRSGDNGQTARVPWSRALLILIPCFALAGIMIWLVLRHPTTPQAGESGDALPTASSVLPQETSTAAAETPIPTTSATATQPSAVAAEEVEVPAPSARPSATEKPAPPPSPPPSARSTSPQSKPAAKPIPKPTATFEPFGEGL